MTSSHRLQDICNLHNLNNERNIHVTLKPIPGSHACSPVHKYYSPDTGGFMKGGGSLISFYSKYDGGDITLTVMKALQQ